MSTIVPEDRLTVNGHEFGWYVGQQPTDERTLHKRQLLRIPEGFTALAQLKDTKFTYSAGGWLRLQSPPELWFQDSNLNGFTISPEPSTTMRISPEINRSGRKFAETYLRHLFATI